MQDATRSEAHTPPHRRWDVPSGPPWRPKRLTKEIKLRIEPSLWGLLQRMCASAHWEQSTMVRFCIREVAGRVGMTEAAGTELAGNG